jgi:hypothetical protein
MRSLLIGFIFSSLTLFVEAQSEIGIEQYATVGQSKSNLLMPVAHYKSRSNWYAEARYNYDELNTVSLYAGRTFRVNRGLSYSITPMIGGMTGDANGGSLALNTEFDFRRFNFSSQSQYSVNADSRLNNFFYSWSELSYQPLDWLFAGVSIQNTQVYRVATIHEPGLLLGFSFNEIEIPIYSFNLLDKNRYIMVGINWQFTNGRTVNKKPSPVLAGD